MTRNYLKIADAGGAMPFAIIGNSPSSRYNYTKPATPPVAKLPLKSPAPVQPAPASNPQMFAPSVGKAASQKYPVYHHCKECKATYGGARAIGAAKVYDVDPSDCRTCSPTAKSDWGKYPVQLAESAIDSEALAEAKKRKADFFESRKSAAIFDGIDKLFNAFVEDKERRHFDKNMPVGFFEKPGITHISADIKIISKPKETHKKADLSTSRASSATPPAPLFRNRAEMFARDKAGKIYGGVWDNDKSFAVPGGGVDDGEDIPTAAAREFFEETGLTVKNPRLLPVKPVSYTWTPEQRAGLSPEKQKYHGSQSHFVTADIDDSVPPSGNPLDHWGANNRGYYSPRKALKLMKGVTPMSPEAFAARIEALKHLLAQAKLQSGVQKAGSINFLKLSADIPTMVSFFEEGGPADRFSKQKAVIDAEAMRQQKALLPTKPMDLTGRPESTNVLDLRKGLNQDAMRQHNDESFANKKLRDQRHAISDLISHVNPSDAPRQPGESESAYLKRFYAAPNNALRAATANTPAPQPLEANISWPSPKVEVKYPKAPTAPFFSGESDSLKKYVRNRSTPDLPPGSVKATPAGPSMPITSPALNKQLGTVPPAPKPAIGATPAQSAATPTKAPSVTAGTTTGIQKASHMLTQKSAIDPAVYSPPAAKQPAAIPGMTPQIQKALDGVVTGVPPHIQRALGGMKPAVSGAAPASPGMVQTLPNPIGGAAPAFNAPKPAPFPASPGVVPTLPNPIGGAARQIMTPGAGMPKMGSINYLSPYGLKQAAEGDKEDPKKPKKKLGPIQHSYVADSVGGTAIERSADKMKTMRKPDSSLYDRFMTSGVAPVNKMLGSRIRSGGARLAHNTPLRILSQFDPTRKGQQEGIVGALAGIRSGNSPQLERDTARMYAEHIKPHQDKLEGAEGPVTKRETPWHVGTQGMFADKDSDVAGHRYMRKERPFHYWLNPMSSAGPLSEVSDRLMRRAYAGGASPNSTVGRFAANAIPGASIFLGGHDAQNKIRRSATNNNIYAPEAKPEISQPYKPYYEEEPAMPKVANWLTGGYKQAKTYPTIYDASYMVGGDKMSPKLQDPAMADLRKGVSEELETGDNTPLAEKAYSKSMGSSPGAAQGRTTVSYGPEELPETKRRLFGLIPPKIPMTQPSRASSVTQLIDPTGAGDFEKGRFRSNSAVAVGDGNISPELLDKLLAALARRHDKRLTEEVLPAAPYLNSRGLTKAAAILKKADPNWLSNTWGKVKNWAADAGTKAVEAFNPDQVSRAGQVYGLNRMAGKGYVDSAVAGHGQLNPVTKGVTGGGLGMLAGAMAPAGMRSVAMPAAAGLGTMFSMANGPKGFEWKNMMKPETLIGGGLAAGAGYLGSKMMGDDSEEEEETDLLGRPRRKPSGGGANWLLPALGIGAAGLGGYALYNHMNKPQAPNADNTARGIVGGPVGAVRSGNATIADEATARKYGLGGPAPAKPVTSTLTGGPTPSQADGRLGSAVGGGVGSALAPRPGIPTTSGAAAPVNPSSPANPTFMGISLNQQNKAPVAPQPQIKSQLFDPGTAAGVNKAIGGPSPFNNGSAPLAAAAIGGVLPAMNQGGAIQEAATGVNPAGVRVAPPSQQLPPNLSPLSKIIYEQPDQLLAGISAIDPTKATPQQQASMRKLFSTFIASEGQNNPAFPRLSEMYRAGYAGDAAALQKAKTYQQILNKAQQIGFSGEDFGNLNSLGEIDTSVPPTPMNLDTFKIPGMEAIGAFGYKDINSLAQAAADGDPNVPNALHALGSEGKITLFKVLQDDKFRQFQTEKGSWNYPAIAADPRAAALHGALQHSARSPVTPLEPYDPGSLANPEAFKALTAGQRLQLVNDIRNPDNLGKALSPLAPEVKQQVISNIASNFSRHAHMRDAEQNMVNVPDYLDPAVQTAIAKARGLSGYQPLNTGQWRDLSAMGGNLGDFMSPYKLRATGALRTPEDIQLQRQAGPEAYKGYSPTQILTSASPEADQNIVNDWTKVLTSNLRKNYSQSDADIGVIPKMDNNQLGPLMIGLGRLKQYRPDVFKAVVNNLNQNFGKIPGTYSRQDRTNVPAYRDQIEPDNPMLDYNWDEHLKRFLGQNNQGSLNATTGLAHSIDGKIQSRLEGLPE